MKTLFTLLAIGLVTTLQNETRAQNPLSNQEIILEEAVGFLQGSELISDFDGPFYLRSNVPENLRYTLIESLVKSDRQIRLNGGSGPGFSLEIHTENEFIRTGRRSAERLITGELILYLTDEHQVVTDTEAHSFQYHDQVPLSAYEMLGSGQWRAARFHKETEGRRRSLLHRVGEPVLIVGATAVTIFLLYNVRS